MKLNRHGIPIYQKQIVENAKKVRPKVRFIKLLRLTSRVVEYYRSSIRDSEHLTEHDIQCKLTRNMLLGYEYRRVCKEPNNPISYYSYGCLRFAVRNNRVIWIKNKCKPFAVWEVDEQKKEDLNRILKIS